MGSVLLVVVWQDTKPSVATSESRRAIRDFVFMVCVFVFVGWCDVDLGEVMPRGTGPKQVKLMVWSRGPPGVVNPERF